MSLPPGANVGPYQILGIAGAAPDAIYARINDVVAALEVKNAAETISVSTTGTITERLRQYGLRCACPDSYAKLRKDWKWIGDFYIKGAPFNTVITVKSFKAKDRLLSSGTGNLLSPTIGFGLFNDAAEWTESRVASYVFRAFFAIHMPSALLNVLTPGVRAKQNINGRPFLRSIDELHHRHPRGIVSDRASRSAAALILLTQLLAENTKTAGAG